jgi:hypothetical protein
MKRIKTRSFRKVKQYEKDKTKISYEIVPKGKNKLLIIILMDSGGAVMKWLNPRINKFSINENTYFTEKGGVYATKNYVFVSVYIEGCSLPINHTLLPKKIEKKIFVNPDTDKTEEIDITYIANLNFDSKIADICLNRHLADSFTKPPKDVRGVITLLLLIVAVLVGLVGVGLQVA